LNANFRFPGWVKYDEMLYYQNLGDVFILPSIRDEEGNLDDQSVSVVEAMACAKPIVTTDFPGYKIVVENGKSGFLVPEKRSDLIAVALNKIILSRKRATSMAKRSRYLAENKLSWGVIGHDYSNLFKRLVNA
jgi:glycosyltransferase involved in cell wall biosynthesis